MIAVKIKSRSYFVFSILIPFAFEAALKVSAIIVVVVLCDLRFQNLTDIKHFLRNSSTMVFDLLKR